MHCGVFGKLPAKRDFIAIDAPREFLEPWERWMQTGMAASREMLGRGWQDAFLTAPIWRFWLGADNCGRTVTGAFMASLDGVGRYFPLTVFAIAEPGEIIAPPEFDARPEWFELAETLMLGALEPDTPYARFEEALRRLPPPQDWSESRSADGMERLRDGAMLLPAPEGITESAFPAFLAAEPAELYAAATFWWTLGGTGYHPTAMALRHMPDPFSFAVMLTGRLDEKAE
jgi:type VI secretion system protein ImpM